MGSISCYENNPCCSDTYNTRQHCCRHDRIKYDRLNDENKQWFVLSKNNFHVAYDEDVAKAMVHGKGTWLYNK